MSSLSVTTSRADDWSSDAEDDSPSFSQWNSQLSQENHQDLTCNEVTSQDIRSILAVDLGSAQENTSSTVVITAPQLDVQLDICSSSPPDASPSSSSASVSEAAYSFQSSPKSATSSAVSSSSSSSAISGTVDISSSSSASSIPSTPLHNTRSRRSHPVYTPSTCAQLIRLIQSGEIPGQRRLTWLLNQQRLLRSQESSSRSSSSDLSHLDGGSVASSNNSSSKKRPLSSITSSQELSCNAEPSLVNRSATAAATCSTAPATGPAAALPSSATRASSAEALGTDKYDVVWSSNSSHKTFSFSSSFAQITDFLSLSSDRECLRGLPIVEEVRAETEKLQLELQDHLTQICALRCQITSLQSASSTAAQRVNASTRQPPPPPLVPPSELKKIPASRCIAVRAVVKGSIQTKAGVASFRSQLEQILSKVELDILEEIRPTQYGGFLIKLTKASARKNIAEKLNASPELAGRVRCPSPRMLQLQVKNVPDDYDTSNLEHDLYSSKNPAFFDIPLAQRKFKYIHTTAGHLINCGSLEIAATLQQKESLCLGSARKVVIKEFISLHLCFQCCTYGHSGYHCQKSYTRCRFCAASTHSGDSCRLRKQPNSPELKCCNCIAQAKLEPHLNIDTSHSACQFDRCYVASLEKQEKKLQRAEDESHINFDLKSHSHSVSSSSESSISQAFSARPYPVPDSPPAALSHPPFPALCPSLHSLSGSASNSFRRPIFLPFPLPSPPPPMQVMPFHQHPSLNAFPFPHSFHPFSPMPTTVHPPPCLSDSASCTASFSTNGTPV